MTRWAWTDRAACRGMPIEIFFPNSGADTATGLAVCAQCPVRQPCADAAAQMPGTSGIWGGRLHRQNHHDTTTRRRAIDLLEQTRGMYASPGNAAAAVARHLRITATPETILRWAREARHAETAAAGP